MTVNLLEKFRLMPEGAGVNTIWYDSHEAAVEAGKRYIEGGGQSFTVEKRYFADTVDKWFFADA